MEDDRVGVHEAEALMPMIMSLEGPRATVADAMRSELYRATPRSIYRLGLGASDIWYKFGMSPTIWTGIFGVLAGAWLASSKSGFAKNVRNRVGGR